MPPRKRSRDEFVTAAPAPAEEATRGRLLPFDLLLEIGARSDTTTLIRCSATCRSLRRDILLPAFIHRVCHDGAVAPRLLGFLGLDLGIPSMPPPSFSLAHPATPAAASLAETHLAPFVSRSGAGADAGRLAGYQALTSRDGLVLLRRIYQSTQEEVTMCVYDPMTGKGTFFPGPPDAGTGGGHGSYFFYDKFVLLTAADGVGCPFLVFSADFSVLRTGLRSMMVRTFSPPSDSDAGAWSAASLASHSPPADKAPFGNAAVVHGGLVHWIIYGVYPNDNYIFSYNVLTAASSNIELPADVPADCRAYRKLHLTSSPANGRRLCLLVVDEFKVSIWLQSDEDGAWARHAVIDAKRIVSSVALVGRYPRPITVDVVGSGARGDTVILLSRPMYTWSEFEEVENGLIVLDLETKDMRVVSKKKHAFLYEVDMASRLSSMKNF